MSDDAYADTPETDDSIQLIKQHRPRPRNPRASHEYKVAHDAYRAKCAVHRQPDGSYGDPCVICHEPISYSLAYPHPLSWSLQHLIAVKERPDLLLDRNNWGSAHLHCNTMQGPEPVESDLGEPSEAW